MWKRVIESLFKEEPPYEIFISDYEYAVKYATDNKTEIESIKQYFKYVWKVSQYEDNVICVIKSVYVQGLDVIREAIPFSYRQEIFYDLQDGFVYEDEKIYICMRRNTDAITVFDKNKKEILFLRENRKIYTIHISQLIKEPLNSLKIKHGMVLLHCAACSYQGDGIVFPAQKAAGKSTLLMEMMNGGVKYIGNDSAFLYIRDGKILIRKNPHAIRLGAETIKNNKCLLDFFSNRMNCPKSKMLNNNLLINGKIQFVTESLNRIWNDSCIEVNDVELKFIIFPKLNLESEGSRYKKVEQIELKEKLLKVINERDHSIMWLPFFKKEELEAIEKEVVQKIILLFEGKIFEMQYDGQHSKVYEIIKKNTESR